MKKIIWTFLIAGFLAAGTVAVHAVGTDANTIITAVSSNLIITYEDESANPQPTVTGDITVTNAVQAVYGLSFSPSNALVPVTVIAGQSASFEFYALNKSNTSTTLNFSYAGYSRFNQPTFNYSNNTDKGVGDYDLSNSLNAGFSAVLVPEDTIATYNFTVTVNADARDNVIATLNIYSFLDLEATPNGSYTGINGNPYGGVSVDIKAVVITASGPDMVFVSKSASISQPALYTGSATDPVPGARIIYQMVVKNNGSATANAVSLEQNIPNDTDYDLGSMTAVQSSGALYAQEFYNDAYNTDAGTGTDASVTKVRWTLTDLDPGATATVNYTVVVR